MTDLYSLAALEKMDPYKDYVVCDGKTFVRRREGWLGRKFSSIKPEEEFWHFLDFVQEYFCCMSVQNKLIAVDFLKNKVRLLEEYPRYFFHVDEILAKIFEDEDVLEVADGDEVNDFFYQAFKTKKLDPILKILDRPNLINKLRPSTLNEVIIEACKNHYWEGISSILVKYPYLWSIDNSNIRTVFNESLTYGKGDVTELILLEEELIFKLSSDDLVRGAERALLWRKEQVLENILIVPELLTEEVFHEIFNFFFLQGDKVDAVLNCINKLSVNSLEYFFRSSFNSEKRKVFDYILEREGLISKMSVGVIEEVVSKAIEFEEFAEITNILFKENLFERISKEFINRIYINSYISMNTALSLLKMAMLKDSLQEKLDEETVSSFFNRICSFRREDMEHLFLSDEDLRSKLKAEFVNSRFQEACSFGRKGTISNYLQNYDLREKLTAESVKEGLLGVYGAEVSQILSHEDLRAKLDGVSLEKYFNMRAYEPYFEELVAQAFSYKDLRAKLTKSSIEKFFRCNYFSEREKVMIKQIFKYDDLRKRLDKDLINSSFFTASHSQPEFLGCFFDCKDVRLMIGRDNFNLCLMYFCVHGNREQLMNALEYRDLREKIMEGRAREIFDFLYKNRDVEGMSFFLEKDCLREVLHDIKGFFLGSCGLDGSPGNLDIVKEILKHEDLRTKLGDVNITNGFLWACHSKLWDIAKYIFNEDELRTSKLLASMIVKSIDLIVKPELLQDVLEKLHFIFFLEVIRLRGADFVRSCSGVFEDKILRAEEILRHELKRESLSPTSSQVLFKDVFLPKLVDFCGVEVEVPAEEREHILDLFMRNVRKGAEELLKEKDGFEFYMRNRDNIPAMREFLGVVNFNSKHLMVKDEGVLELIRSLESFLPTFIPFVRDKGGSVIDVSKREQREVLFSLLLGMIESVLDEALVEEKNDCKHVIEHLMIKHEKGVGGGFPVADSSAHEELDRMIGLMIRQVEDNPEGATENLKTMIGLFSETKTKCFAAYRGFIQQAYCLVCNGVSSIFERREEENLNPARKFVCGTLDFLLQLRTQDFRNYIESIAPQYALGMHTHYHQVGQWAMNGIVNLEAEMSPQDDIFAGSILEDFETRLEYDIWLMEKTEENLENLKVATRSKLVEKLLKSYTLCRVIRKVKDYIDDYLKQEDRDFCGNFLAWAGEQGEDDMRYLRIIFEDPDEMTETKKSIKVEDVVFILQKIGVVE